MTLASVAVTVWTWEVIAEVTDICMLVKYCTYTAVSLPAYVDFISTYCVKFPAWSSAFNEKCPYLHVCAEFATVEAQ